MGEPRNSKQKRRLKALLFAGRDEKPCCFCGTMLLFGRATLEHVVPLSQRGGWKIENLRISCASCNHERNVTDFYAFRSLKRAKLKGVDELKTADRNALRSHL